MGTSCKSCSGEEDTFHPFPSLIPGSGTCDPNNIEHNWVCQLPSMIPGLQMWRQLTYPSILPWHPLSSADTFQNPAVPSYHLPGSLAPFHPASRTASCQGAFIASPRPKGGSGYLQSDRGIKAAQRALTCRKLSCPWPCPTQP